MKTKNSQAGSAGGHSLENPAHELNSPVFGMPPLGAKFDRIKKHVSRWKKPREGSSSSLAAPAGTTAASNHVVPTPHAYPRAGSENPLPPAPPLAPPLQPVLRSATGTLSHVHSSSSSSSSSIANSKYGFGYNGSAMNWQPAPAAATVSMNVTPACLHNYVCNGRPVACECSMHFGDPCHEKYYFASQAQIPRSLLSEDEDSAVNGNLANSLPSALQQCAYSGRQIPTFDEWWTNAVRDTGKDVFRDIARALHHSPPAPSAVLQVSGNRAMSTIARQLSQFTCNHCGSKFNLKATDVIANMQAMITDYARLGRVTSGYECSQCMILNCLGCGVAAPSSYDSTGSDGRPIISLCCGVGRMMLIWALCCGVEYHEITSPAASAQAESGRYPFHIFRASKKQKGHTVHASLDSTATGSSSSKAPPSKPHGKSKSLSGKPASSKAVGADLAPGSAALSKKNSKAATPNGVGYGDGSYFWLPLTNSHSAYGSAQTRASVMAEDSKYQTYYLMLSRLLPRSAGGAKFDAPSPECSTLLRHILCRSPLLAKASEYLRNTSIDDITKRYELYNSLWQFLDALCDQPALAVVVTQPRILFADEEQLAHACFAASEATASAAALTETGKDKEKERESSESLAVLLHRMAELCRFVLQQSTYHSSEYLTGDGLKTLNICRNFSGLSERLASVQSQTRQDLPGDSAQTAGGLSKPIRTSSRTRKATGLAEERRRAEQVTAWHREHCLSDMEDGKVIGNSYFETLTRSIQASPKGRMKRLINDVNILRSSLPEGIFVRHASSRLDVMKAIIIGPRGTPYENGMFEFDIFCPVNFPQSPPHMRLKTTGQGQVRFNPNLYHDGTVCLSLLGTWGQGQTWHPEHSTLLQVLVSIQAMIFCEEPYYNEPGRESRKEPAASARENAAVQKNTVQHAMLYWLNMLSLDKGNTKDGTTSISQSLVFPDMAVWEDVVRKHFALNANAIVQTVSGWGVQDQRFQELTTALRRHSFLD